MGQEEVAPANALDWMKRARSFEAVGITEPRRLFSTIAGREPETVLGARVSEQFFKVLGTSMLYLWPCVSAAGVSKRRRSRGDSQPRDLEGQVWQ